MTDQDTPTQVTEQSPGAQDSAPLSPLPDSPDHEPQGSPGGAQEPQPAELTRAQRALVESRERRARDTARKEREALAAEREQLARDKASLAEEQAKRRELYKKDPSLLLKDHDLDYSKLTDHYLGLANPEKEVHQRLAEVDLELARLKEEKTKEKLDKEAEKQAREHDQLVAQQQQTYNLAFDKIKTRLDGDEGNSFPLVKENGAYQYITDVVVKHFYDSQMKEILDPMLVAAEVEKELQRLEEEEDKRYNERQLKKASRKGADQTMKPETVQSKKPEVEQSKPKTISNVFSVSAGVDETGYHNQLSHEKKMLKEMAQIVKFKKPKTD